MLVSQNGLTVAIDATVTPTPHRLRLSSENEAEMTLDQRISRLTEFIYPIVYVMESLRNTAGINDELIETLKAFTVGARRFDRTPLGLTRTDPNEGLQGRVTSKVDYLILSSCFDIAALMENIRFAREEINTILKDRGLNKPANVKFIEIIKAAKLATEAFEARFKEQKLDTLSETPKIHVVERISAFHSKTLQEIRKKVELINDLVYLKFESAEHRLDEIELEVDQIETSWSVFGVHSDVIERLVAGTRERTAFARKANEIILQYQDQCLGIERCVDQLKIIDCIESDGEAAVEFLVAQLQYHVFNHKNVCIGSEQESLSGAIKLIEDNLKILETNQIILGTLSEHIGEIEIKVGTARGVIESYMRDDRLDDVLILFRSRIKEMESDLIGAKTDLEDSVRDLSVAQECLQVSLDKVLTVFRYAKAGQNVRDARKHIPNIELHRRFYKEASQESFQNLEKNYDTALNELIGIRDSVPKDEPAQEKLRNFINSQIELMQSVWKNSEKTRRDVQEDVMQTGRLLSENPKYNSDEDFRDMFPGLLEKAVKLFVG